MRHLLTAAAVCAVLALAGCGGDEVPDGTGPDPVTSSSAAPEPSPEEPATPTFTAPGDPAFCEVAADDTLDTAEPGTQEYADGTAALAAAAPDEIADAAENLRVLGEVQLGLGTDGTADELQVAMTERGIDVITLLDAFARVGGYIDTCEA